jgi:ribonucleoside-diphosphate reductase alpha chain
MVELAPISKRIWTMKYRLKDDSGRALEESIVQTWQRVARALAAVEPHDRRETWRARFEAALQDFRFMPAGRILAGAGVERDLTLFNCFVMGTIPDDMGGIFAQLREAALTMQQGGGIGYDFSTLRPKGAPVRGVGADASGPVSFMDVWDAMCRTIMSAGSRRGAMMGTLRCDHPDIEAFVAAKQDPERLRMFNVSVLVTDAFMDAVDADRDWPLVFNGETYRTLRARDLWHQIMRATYDYAEPGVIFIDRINQHNNLWYCEEIHASNPCGEQPLPPYGACLLGSINLAQLVEKPFTPEARLDTDALAKLVPVAVRMLDNAIDASGFPLEAQRHEADAKRRIGLGVTGLADALVMCGYAYGSSDAVALTDTWMAALRDHAYRASVELAEERGAFPLFDADKYLQGTMIRQLDADLRQRIAQSGIRNALVTSVAPTGTISLLANNVSSGLEPVYSRSYTRNVLEPDGSRSREEVTDYALEVLRRVNGPAAALPESFVDVGDLTPAAHVAMQAAVQRHIDASVSKTINVPADIPFESFKDVYRQAYDLGCKGCTTYRPNPVTGAVLERAGADDQAREAAGTSLEPARQADVTAMTEPLERPEVLPGRTYKLVWPGSDHAIYITLNDIMVDGERRPFEIFINSKNMEHYAWTVALTRMISAVFRRGGNVSFVVEELKAVFDPRGGAWHQGRYKPSLLAAIGEVIEQHMIDIGFRHPPSAKATHETTPDRGAAPVGTAAPPPRQCPRCGAAAVIAQEGCDLCTTCGYSRCL